MAYIKQRHEVKEEIKNLSHSMRKRFVKDFSLPIQTLQDPYFEYMVNLTDQMYSTREKLDLLFKAMEIKDIHDEEGFFSYYNHLKDEIINFIKESNEYKEFCNFDIGSILTGIPYPVIRVSHSAISRRSV